MISPLLAQVDPTAALGSGLASNPLAYGLALAIAAVAYLFRALNDERTAHAKELAAASERLVTAIQTDAKEQREILSQIVPLSSKLTEGLEILERVTDTLTKD